MAIIIPMAGLSKRFFDAGYDLPKYMLKINNVSLFNHSVSSFKKYFNSEKFVFIARNDYGTEAFIENEVNNLGIDDFDIVILDKVTLGQADTVIKGLNKIKLSNEERIIIFNIDTIRKNFEFPSEMKNADGYLEVFNGSGTHWSFVLPGPNNSVIRTTEKDRISDLCSTGLYYFRNYKLFYNSLNFYKKNQKLELYIAPMYNYLISRKFKILYNKIPKDLVLFSGTPTEFNILKKNEIK